MEIMRSEQVLQMVRDWFAQGRRIGLELPSGWFGRPYDNQHELTFSVARPHKLILELDSRLCLVFTDVARACVEADALVLSGFKQLVFDWQEFGNDERCHLTVYKLGTARFVAH